METALYAKKDCRLCHGKGRVRTGEHIGEEVICPCVILGKRQADAERAIAQRLPERAKQMTLEGYDPGGDPKNEQALAIARNFVDNYEQAEREGWVLGFWGLPNSGKTHLTLGIAQECVRRYNAKAVIFNISAELRRERERFRAPAPRFQGAGDVPAPPSPIDRAVAAGLLVLDDIGAEYHRQGAETDQVSWVYEQLYTILEERIMACRPTLYSSNLSPSDLARRMGNESGKRVLSRIERSQVTPALEVVEVPGANRQSEAAAAKLFAPRLAQEFELFNRQSKQRKRYNEAALLAVIARFRERHGEEEVAAQLKVTRILRDDTPVREPVDIVTIFAQLADAVPA
jgi:DNA replication protein DnaC